jgi:hypothetical protein
VEESKVGFLNLFGAKVVNAIGIGVAKWIAVQQSKARDILLDPRPHCMKVNLINSNHV